MLLFETKHTQTGIDNSLNEMAVRTGLLEKDVIVIKDVSYYEVYNEGKLNLMDFDGNYLFDDWCDDIVISNNYITLLINGKIQNIDK